jgi:CheY-like chemotaxis protein
MNVNSGRKTILVVDDQLGCRELVSEFLEYIGYKVLQAPEGAAALALLQDNDQIDLLFTNVNMPLGMDGIELARRARQQNPRLNVVFCSGGFRRDQLKPTDRFLGKPFHLLELKKAVADALANSGE